MLIFLTTQQRKNESSNGCLTRLNSNDETRISLEGKHIFYIHNLIATNDPNIIAVCEHHDNI